MAVQNIFTLGYYQWVVVQEDIDLSSAKYLKEQRLVLSRGLCILQGLLDTQSDGNPDGALWRHSLGSWASLLANLARTALDNSLNKPRGAQMVDGAIKTYVRLLCTCHLCSFLKSEGSTL